MNNKLTFLGIPSHVSLFGPQCFAFLSIANANFIKGNVTKIRVAPNTYKWHLFQKKWKKDSLGQDKFLITFHNSYSERDVRSSLDFGFEICHLKTFSGLEILLLLFRRVTFLHSFFFFAGGGGRGVKKSATRGSHFCVRQLWLFTLRSVPAVGLSWVYQFGFSVTNIPE